MEDIVEYLGIGFLQILAGVAILVILDVFLTDAGAFPEIIRQFMNGICG